MIPKPYIKAHLYETAHSGFYDGELSAKTVNLLPKTWSKFTVTDGDWKTEKTLEPLWNRDIYLANEIDKIEVDKRNHYKAGSHFLIDHENRIMDVYPFDTLYKFTNGILYDAPNYYVYTDLPERMGGLENRLYFKDNNSGLSYHLNTHPPVITSADIPDPEFKFSATINDVEINEQLYNDTMENVSIIICSGELYYHDIISAGEWHCSSGNYWDKQQQKRIIGTATIPGYTDDPAKSADYIKDKSKGPSSEYDCFNPNDRTPTSTASKQINGGSNFISGNMDMAPVNVLYIW